MSLHRSCHWRCSVRKGVLRNFKKFTAKQLCQSLYFHKVAGLILAQVFSCEFCKISENTFFTERLWVNASITVIFKYFVNCLVTSISRNSFLWLLLQFISSVYFFCSNFLQKFPNVLPRTSKLFVRPHLDHRGILYKGYSFDLHQKLQFQCNASNHRYHKGNFQRKTPQGTQPWITLTKESFTALLRFSIANTQTTS